MSPVLAPVKPTTGDPALTGCEALACPYPAKWVIRMGNETRRRCERCTAKLKQGGMPEAHVLGPVRA